MSDEKKVDVPSGQEGIEHMTTQLHGSKAKVRAKAKVKPPEKPDEDAPDTEKKEPA